MPSGRSRDRRKVREEQQRAARSQREHFARDIGDERALGGVRRATLRISKFNWLVLAGVVLLMAIFTVTLIARQRPAQLDVKADCSKVAVHFDQTSYGSQAQMLFRVTGPAGPTYRIVLHPHAGGSDIAITPQFTMPGCISHSMADRAPTVGTYDVTYETVDSKGNVEQTHVVDDLIVA
ncbi:hypothetical protein CLV47_1267 [Antricoccus suffuscus]|uniref:Uncharacterized protein n=1 Tax=Antricoccus suffuscus TaxID=1629062 RepID=A0A2T0Z997_9ACTN|nr:hypothetical protein [Antricoccus suffuscus]PRZ32734.1 hypothetical protein CLV47_1267 [Antricoccus suffuscus]